MIFKYNAQVNREYWEVTIKHKEMFGMKFPEKISITKEDENMAKKVIPEFSDFWNKDEDIRSAISKIYQYKLPKTLECYIVTTKTSAINLEKSNILLSMHVAIDKIRIVIIHEFSHIAFFKKWGDFCKKLGYTKNGIQELKEVLTVINNFEFKDVEDKDDDDDDEEALMETIDPKDSSIVDDISDEDEEE